MKMKTSFFLSAVMAAGLLASCSNREEIFNGQVTDGEHSGAQLNIVPTVSSESTETRAGFDPKTDWAAGDALGLFMYKSSGWGDAYPRYDAQNNKSTRQANGWSQASPVYLLVDKATIWAYYPPSVTCPLKISSLLLHEASRPAAITAERKKLVFIFI